MSYPPMKTRTFTGHDTLVMDVEHHPAQSYSRAVTPAAMRAVNSPAGRVELARIAAGRQILGVETASVDHDQPTTIDGTRPTWQGRGEPVTRSSRSVARYTFRVVTRELVRA